VISPFVDAGWLEGHLEDVVPADVRWYMDGRSGRDAHAGGHIPGAVFVDVDHDLAAAPAERLGRHPLPSAELFAERMGALGIGDGDTVVAYDDAGGVIAARLVWMLRAVGHEAAVLDGGLAAWSGELESGPVARTPANLTARRWPAPLLADIDEVAAGGAVLIDARQRERFHGAPDELDPRAGHIPGAVSVPCRENLGPGGALLPRAELRSRFERAGVADGREVISYCGSGVTACHNLLVLEHAGLGRGRLYPGSWSQWSRDPARRAETD